MNTPIAYMEDKQGNRLIRYSSGQIRLQLLSEKFERLLGVVVNDVLNVVRDSSKHLHRKTNSYGFNYHLIYKARSYKYVQIDEDGINLYKIPIDTIMQYGKILHFKDTDNSSFELQIFLSRGIINNYKINKTENNGN